MAHVQFNTALKQSSQIRKELGLLTSGANPTSPAALGGLSASLTAFSRTLDEYNQLAKQELVIAKQEKAYERLKNFRSELAEYREQFNALKADGAESQYQQNRSDLLGRRPYQGTSTPENPYANVGAAETTSGEVPANRYGSGGTIGGQLSMGSNDYTRESHAFRERNFFNSTNQALDDYIARGQAVLGDLGEQREMLKNTQKKLYSVGNTLGISGDTIRMIERRAKQDKWIFWGGVIVFVGFCWLCLHYLR
ncbi:hypothetical protein JX265_012393 [Neoarthrinium moseri]|uniref:Protein transport protein BOS1 n=1 Tax=Neoarthrinium moseri TaxID=1658444 RepID=A0A9P9WAD7_9PEZI|nr:uncharacterized protein JN550_011160 [Neoarthrinium moseri]KAI1851525.1 hypothetical protein JX266_002987 [Neoarthrinium moseri]KAI1855038.1 hypothetical protein JX265_012393 [Neoarthrinium moseri]KAI1860845.1 hypothetical protein JN550_011160 [Neoarthrinium moseri]